MDAKWWQYLTWPFGSGELKKKQLSPTSNHWTQKLDSLTVLTYKTDSHDFVESCTKYHKPNPNPLPTELKEISTKLAKGGYQVFQ